MIGSLKGKITFKEDKFVIIEVGGVGYKVHISPDATLRIKKDEETLFWIHSHIREDALDLYGFLDQEELKFFEMLLSVPSVGPKSAIAILGITSIDALRKAISTGDVTYLIKVSGIGKKTAEKIVIELRDKIKNDSGENNLQEELDALEALKSLGYSQNEAREALKKVEVSTDTNAKIREALKILGRK